MPARPGAKTPAPKYREKRYWAKIYHRQQLRGCARRPTHKKMFERNGEKVLHEAQISTPSTAPALLSDALRGETGTGSLNSTVLQTWNRTTITRIEAHLHRSGRRGRKHDVDSPEVARSARRPPFATLACALNLRVATVSGCSQSC